MRYLAAYLTPAGAGVMLICFFLPWMVVECHPRAIEGNLDLAPHQVAQFSGFRLAQVRSFLWGVPISAFGVLFFAASRLPIRWRYRLCLIAALGGIVTLAVSYETFQRIDQGQILSLIRQNPEAEDILRQIPPAFREIAEDSLQQVREWNRTAGVEITVDFSQAYSLTWAGCVLAVVSSLVMLLRLARPRPPDMQRDELTPPAATG